MRLLIPIDKKFFYHGQSLSVMALSAFLKRHGHEVKVVEAEYEAIKEELKEDIPTIVTFSSTTPSAGCYLDLNRRIKREHDVLTFFGGPHATFYPEMIETEPIDGICRGEGEEALYELVDKLEKGEPIESIPNWWIRKNGRIYHNPVRPLIEDLDQLPFPDRTLFTPKTGVDVMSSRGCPFRCTYCFNHYYNKLYGQKKIKVRRRSVRNFVEELKEINRMFPKQFFTIVDDSFITSEEWLEEFSNLYPKEVNRPFACQVNPNQATPRVASMLKNAGCYLVGIGIESGNETIRKEVLKRFQSNERIIQAVKCLKDQGIRVFSYNLLKLPKGSVETDLETLRLNIETGVDYAKPYLLQPYRRTEICDLAEELGILESEGSLSGSEIYRAWTVPRLRYSNPQEELMITNLCRLFSISVNLPFLFPLTKLLIRLPLTHIYRYVDVIWAALRAFRLYPVTLPWLLSFLKQELSRSRRIRKNRRQHRSKTAPMKSTRELRPNTSI